MKKSAIILSVFLAIAFGLTACSSDTGTTSNGVENTSVAENAPAPVTGKVALEDYLIVVVEGADGEGTASADLEIDTLFEAVTAQKIDGTDLDMMLDAYSLANEITLELDKSSGLSNGDTVTITATTSKEVAKDYGLASETASRTIMVEGLGIHPYDALIAPEYFDDGLVQQFKEGQGIEAIANDFSRMPYQPTYEGALGTTRYITEYEDLQLEVLYLAISHVSVGKNPAQIWAIYSADCTFENEGNVGTRYFTANFLNPTYTQEEGSSLDWDASYNVHGAFATLQEAQEYATTPSLSEPEDWDFHEIPID